MTSWVTGAAGFIGTRLCACLAEAGDVCVGLDRNAADGRDLYLSGSVSEGVLSRLLSMAGAPDVVYHLAGGPAVGPSFADPAADFDSTVRSATLLLAFLRDRAPRARVVLASSAAVYGNAHLSAVDETATLNPMSPYGVHKRLMEDVGLAYARLFDLDVRIARLFSVYGAGLRKQIFWDLCGKLAKGEDVVLGGTGEEVRDFIAVSDVVDGLVTLANAERGGVAGPINIGTGTATTIKVAAGLAAEAWTRATGRTVGLSFSGVCRVGDPTSLLASTGRMRALGFAPSVTPQAGIAAYVSWYARAFAS